VIQSNVPKVSGLQTRRLSLRNVESNLESGIQDIEKTVGETPKEEEDCDHGNWDNGLASSDLSRASDLAIANALPAPVDCNGFSSGRATSLLLMNLVQSRLCGLSSKETHDGLLLLRG
jgi:hypothetical protein